MMASAAVGDIGGGNADDLFWCPEESRLYAECLKTLILARQDGSSTIVEFGSGDGKPVIDALRGSPFAGAIRGFEINPLACDMANASIRAYRLQGHYTVSNQSFFAQARPEAGCLIANPPYLPAPDNDLRLPLLYGGEDGSTLTNALLSLGYDRAMLMISSYSNPAGTLHHAHAHGYRVRDFTVAPLAFGIYSSEPKVRRRIENLRRSGLAFYDGEMYLLAGVLFEQHAEPAADLSAGLIKLMTAL